MSKFSMIPERAIAILPNQFLIAVGDFAEGCLYFQSRLAYLRCMAAGSLIDMVFSEPEVFSITLRALMTICLRIFNGQFAIGLFSIFVVTFVVTDGRKFLAMPRRRSH
jgi:hypothetical protein